MAGRATNDHLTCERSALVNREVVLFLFQREMDSQLQRALTYEDFEEAKDIRKRREQVDRALAELREHKGYADGSRRATASMQMDLAPMAINLRVQLTNAVTEERYADAAALRDQLAALEHRATEAELPCAIGEPRFALGQMVVHSAKGYRGVVAGWDLACCESTKWRAGAGVDALSAGSDQVFYHVLVDVADWPHDEDEPPVAYVAEELLTAASMVDFGSVEPLVDSSFQHPYSYLMFLGSDGHGNMVPCSQLRDKYCQQRLDVFLPGEEPQWEGGEEEGGSGSGGGTSSGPDDSGPGGLGGPDSAGPKWGSGSRIPGIDMRSLD